MVSTNDEQREFAAAAWQILQQAGGLVGRPEIAERLDISVGRTWHLTRQRHFPDPVAQIAGRELWLAADVEAYRATPAPVGRPPKSKQVV